MPILDLPVPVTGDKAFSGTVTLERDDTSLGTFNGVDLGDTISAQAFIDEDNSFSSTDTFSSGKKKIEIRICSWAFHILGQGHSPNNPKTFKGSE